MSKKIKYRYNPETLQYEKIEQSFLEHIIKAIPWLASSIVFALVTIIIYENQPFFKSPREQALERDNKQLRKQFELIKKQLQDIEVILADMQQRDDNIYRLIFEAEPYPKYKREKATGGNNKYKEFENYTSGELIISTHKLLDRIEKKIYAQSKSFDEVIALAKRKEKLLNSIPAIMPITKKYLTAGIGPFGWRIDPIYKTRAMHTGMDFPAATGTDVYATGDGVVQSVESNYWGYGNIVLINHGFGYQTLYAHLSAFDVKIGQKVKRGQVIGKVGSTGKSTAPHLHYEVWKNGEKVNPVNYYFNDLTPDQYEELLKAAANSSSSFD